MKQKESRKARAFCLLIFAAAILIVSAVVSAEPYSFVGSDSSASIVNTQYYNPGAYNFRTYYTSEQIGLYWPVLSNRDECRASTDFMVQIAPGGCTPAVVRSDLLEEQNVPVFCRLQSVKLNPSIDVTKIRNIIPSLVQETVQPENSIVGLGYHPARAALRTREKLTASPVINDIGYVVVVLKQQPVEKNMSEWIEANLTARIVYDAAKAFGIGKAEMFLPAVEDEEWNRDYVDYGFWRGKGYLRAEWIEPNRASVSLYTDKDTRYSNIVLEKGKTSEVLYLPGNDYCRRGFEITLQDITNPSLRAVLEVDDDRLELYSGATFIDGQCRVTDIKYSGEGTGEAWISCPRERFKLALGIKQVRISVDGEEKGYSAGDRVADAGGNNLYAAYVGRLPKAVKVSGVTPEESERLFAVLVDSAKSGTDVAKLISSVKAKVSDLLKNEKEFSELKNKMQAAGLFDAGAQAFVLLNMPGYNEIGYNGKTISFLGAVAAEDRDYSEAGDEGRVFEDYFKKAIQAYRDVVIQFPDEKKNEAEGISYGEQAVQSAIELAESAEKYKTARELKEEFLERYPDSGSANDIADEIHDSDFYDERNASRIAVVDFEAHSIKLVEIKEPDRDETGTKLTLRNKATGKSEQGTYINGELVGGGITTLPDKERCSNLEDNITLSDITEDSIKIRSRYCDFRGSDKEGRKQYAAEDKTFTLKQGESKEFGDYEIFVDEIKFTRVAHILLNPKTYGNEIQSNFSFKIGIEKRAIQLSPEKTAEMIEKLNETIRKWQDINEKVGNAVEGLKGACFATSAVLTIKNLISGFSGESIARQRVMRNGGWTDKCTEWHAKGIPRPGSGHSSYATIDDCLRQNSDAIDADVKKMTEFIQEQNEEIQGIEKEAGVTKSTFFGKSVDTGASAEKYIGGLQTNLAEAGIINDENGKNPLNIGDIVKKLDWGKGDATYEQLRAIDYYNSVRKDSVVSEVAREQAERQLYSTLTSIQVRQESRSVQAGLAQALGLQDYQVPFSAKERSRSYAYEPLTFERIKDKISLGTNKIGDKEFVTPFATSDGKEYLFTLKQEGDRFTIDKAYDMDGTAVTGVSKESFNVYFEKYDETSYQNEYKTAEVRFYETEPYKGMPAVVPIDTKNGWYAATKQTLPVFGNSKPFEESGKVSSFWLCNVGKNGVEQFGQGIGIGDDVCGMFNLNTGQPLDVFSGLKKEDASKLVLVGIQALQDAAAQYPNKMITIKGVKETYRFNTGKPATSGIGTQCQDFMSPKDCWVMFNVCDPVVCPTSRCNLGGAYPVDDVIQSGIVGSIALCLPNIREKIFVPVCLTGIHAGLEGWISILKARRDCLQESLNTGRTVGICDQIHSVYACDFWWRQFAPMMNTVIKKSVEWMYGQGTKGGGEYMTVNEAWNNAEKSWQYFTTFYAQDSKLSFTARSFADIGTEVCKMGISTRYPSGFKGLFEPESPPQIHAWFDEMSYTEATYPATSQYKVYYNIFAGQDEGAYYSVYLKAPAIASYYQSNPFVSIDSGFIPAGESVDTSRDFTAPAGYKEICVRVNTKDYCGFKQVSTSFALNFARESYLGEQASQRVTSERECVSGSPSLYPLAQPNLQAGAEEAALPELYNRGVIRICASRDPGEGTEPGRWEDVGYCDDESVRCWIDTASVEDNIRNKNILNKTLAEINSTSMQNLIDRGYFDEAKGKELLSKIEESSTELKKMLNSINIELSTGASVTLSTPFAIQEVKTEDTAELSENTKTQLDSALKSAEELVDTIDDAVANKLIYNSQKAEALVLKASVYDAVVRKIHDAAVKIIGEKKRIEEERAEANKKIAGVPAKGVWEKDSTIRYEITEDDSRWIIAWQDAKGIKLSTVYIGKENDLGEKAVSDAIKEGPLQQSPSSSAGTGISLEGVFSLEDDKIYYNEEYTQLYLTEDDTRTGEYIIMQDGSNQEAGSIDKFTGEISDKVGVTDNYVAYLKTYYTLDDSQKLFNLKPGAKVEAGEEGKIVETTATKEVQTEIPPVSDVLDYTSEHADVIGAVCGVLGLSGITTTVAAKLGITAVEKAPLALIQEGAGVLAAAGSVESTVLITIRNIDGISYAMTPSGQILGQVGNGMRIFKIPVTAATASGIATKFSIAPGAVGNGVVEGLSLVQGSKIVSETGLILGEVGGEGTLIASKGGLKFASNALLKAAPVLQKVSLVLAPVTLASAMCDVGALTVSIIDASDSLEVMDESAKAADEQMGLLVETVTEKMIEMDERLHDAEGKLDALQDSYPNDYERLKEMLPVKDFNIAVTLYGMFEERYNEYLNNDVRIEIGFVNSAISNIKSGFGLWGTPERSSAFSDEEYAELLSLERQIRERLVEIAESADDLSEEMGVLSELS